MKLYYAVIEDEGDIIKLLDQGINTGVTDRGLQENLYNELYDSEYEAVDKYVTWHANQYPIYHHDICIVTCTMEETDDDHVISVTDYKTGEVVPCKEYGATLINLFDRRK